MKEDDTVPYENLADLPDSVRRNLPKHAQEIYRAAFNSAEEQYGEESRAHRRHLSAIRELARVRKLQTTNTPGVQFNTQINLAGAADEDSEIMESRRADSDR